VESEPSETVCKVPVDLDPPAKVTGLSVTEEGGAITLRWEPNGEEDLGGYIVLRREVGSDTLQKLTLEPLTKTSYTDSSVMSGRMYIYVVQAVDNRIPLPNVSDPEETPTITAR
jgi:fibronectin type 3 domain-containing protein